MSALRVLALDLGTKCGWAANYGHPSSGVWDLKPRMTESAGLRYVKFKEHLLAAWPDFIVYEEVKYHRAVEAAQTFGGFQAILQSYCLDALIEYRGVPVSVIQKHATGRGMAPKGQKKKIMYDLAVQKFKGTNVIDDNQADALWLLDYVLSPNANGNML